MHDQEVTVWLAWRDLGDDRLLARLEATLTADERTRASRYQHAEDGRAFVWSRGVQRDILSRRLGVDAHALRFAQAGDGKPLLAFPPAVACEYNASHSAELFGLAVSERPVGLDIERVRPMTALHTVARRVFDPRVHAAIAGSPDPAAAFFTEWTRLEAHAKLHGHGVWRILAERESHAAAEGVQVASLEMPAGYYGAVAVAGAVPKVEVRWWGDGA